MQRKREGAEKTDRPKSKKGDGEERGGVKTKRGGGDEEEEEDAPLSKRAKVRCLACVALYLLHESGGDKPCGRGKQGATQRCWQRQDHRAWRGA